MSRRGIAAGVAVVLAGASAALAFYAVPGTGTAQGAVATVSDGVAVNGTSTFQLDIGRPVPLAGHIFSNVDEPLRVAGIQVSVVRVDVVDGVEPGSCTPDDFATTDAVPDQPYEVPANGSLPWTEQDGGSIVLVNAPDRNQNGCQGATVRVAYTALDAA